MNLLLKKIALVAAATFSAGCAAETRVEFETKFNALTQEALALYPVIIEELSDAGLSEDDLAAGLFNPETHLPSNPIIPPQTMLLIAKMSEILNREVCDWLRFYTHPRLFETPEERNRGGFSVATRDATGNLIPHSERVALTDEEFDYRMGFLECRRLGIRNIARKILGLADRTLEQLFLIGRSLNEAQILEYRAAINHWSTRAEIMLVELAGNPENPQHEIGVRGLAELGLRLNPVVGHAEPIT